MNRSLFGLFLFISLSACQSEKSVMTDLEGNTYPTIQYAGTTWMVENLRVTQDKFGKTIKHYLPDNNSGNTSTYGLLYDYETACKVCPTGWTLPTNEDWQGLFKLSEGNRASDYKDNQFWEGETNTNSSGFSVRPAGSGNNAEHPNNFNERTLFWSATKDGEDYVWTFILEKGKDSIRSASQHPTYAFSVRCIRRY